MFLLLLVVIALVNLQLLIKLMTDQNALHRVHTGHGKPGKS